MKQLVFLTNQKLNTNYSYTNIVQKVKRGTLNCIEFYDFIQAMGLTVEIK
ncbi:MAG: hypothetical protein LUH05_04905 [Candidatus Gastranaerophilales bacterium]|nr:hypothetical protein [Candidatus Gastranaerophilales bacterium]